MLLLLLLLLLYSSHTAGWSYTQPRLWSVGHGMSDAEKGKEKEKCQKQEEGIELLLSSHTGYRQNRANNRERTRTEEQTEFWTEFWGPRGRLRSVYTPEKETLG